MKKGVFVLLLVSIVLASFLVSAQSITEDLKKIGEGFWKVIKPIANFAIGGGESLNSDVFFARILLLVLLIVLSFIFYNEWPLLTGKKVVLATQPIDPFDPFRGQYMSINYEISRIKNFLLFKAEYLWEILKMFRFER